MSAVIHIAAQANQVGSQLRQRCAWCGAVLIDMDLGNVMVAPGSDPTPATWEPGRLVAIDRPASYLVEHKDGDRLPEGACGLIDHEVTL